MPSFGKKKTKERKRTQINVFFLWTGGLTVLSKKKNRKKSYSIIRYSFLFGFFSHYKLKMFFFSLLIPVLLVLGLSGGMVRGLGSASTGVERERERKNY